MFLAFISSRISMPIIMALYLAWLLVQVKSSWIDMHIFYLSGDSITNLAPAKCLVNKSSNHIFYVGNSNVHISIVYSLIRIN